MIASSLSRTSTPPAQPSKTIDDLTTALSSFSRAHTPDPQVICCCKREDCESARAWAAMRAKLENRLVLSAEVGQALLERHEAYVRRQDAALSRQASSVYSFTEDDDSLSLQQHVEYLTKKLDTVTEENTLMDSRLNDLMIKHEMADASTRTIMRELQESRATIGRLSAQNARSAGWEMRLEQVTQERDDMRQERDSEAHRARHSESKAAAFVDKCAKLQNEVHALREEVYKFRASRADFSKNVLQEARARLESLQHSLGRDQAREDPETTLVLETLVADNETLKRDIAELQNLLVESREDVRTFREELEERRASAPDFMDADMTKVATPPSSALYIPRTQGQVRARGYNNANGGALAQSLLFGSPHAPGVLPPTSRPSTRMKVHRRSPSDNSQILYDDAIGEWQNDITLSPQLQSRYPHAQSAKYSPSGELERALSPAVKPLFLLTHSRAVQTDPYLGFSYPSPRPSTLGVDGDNSPLSSSAPEGRSDTSSVNQQDPRTVGALLERVSMLLLRLTQTDVKTLMNRLKRQHLVSDDLGHLSRTTIEGILNEVASLRAQIVGGKDDVLLVTKADSKALLKFFKDVFAELGALREQLNAIILDPAAAHRLRKACIEPERLNGDARPSSAMGGWIAPIQKLFTSPTASTGPGPTTSVEPSSVLGKSVGDVGRGRPPARVVPKLAPAISATSTTVNVEFASSGVRKTDASESTQMQQQQQQFSPVAALSQQQVSGPTALRRPIAVSHAHPSRHLMDIFAGAPRSVTNSSVLGDAWVVLPKNDKDRVRQLKAAASSAMLGGKARNSGTNTIGRSSVRNANRLSRNVDAIIDQNNEDIPDFRETLLERTLRPRGLSDSSIHTSYLKGETSPVGETHSQQHSDSSQDTDVGVPFRPQATGGISPSTPGSSSPARPAGYSPLDRDGRERSPVARIGRSLASWATAAAGGLDDLNGLHPSDLVVGSPREDSVLHAAWSRRGLQGRNF